MSAKPEDIERLRALIRQVDANWKAKDCALLGKTELGHPNAAHDIKALKDKVGALVQQNHHFRVMITDLIKKLKAIDLTIELAESVENELYEPDDEEELVKQAQAMDASMDASWDEQGVEPYGEANYPEHHVSPEHAEDNW